MARPNDYTVRVNLDLYSTVELKGEEARFFTEAANDRRITNLVPPGSLTSDAVFVINTLTLQFESEELLKQAEKRANYRMVIGQRIIEDASLICLTRDEYMSGTVRRVYKNFYKPITVGPRQAFEVKLVNLPEDCAGVCRCILSGYSERDVW